MPEALQPSVGRARAKVVVLTALRLEYDAVRSHLKGDVAMARLRGGLICEVGRFKGQRIDWEVAIAEIGAGNAGAAAAAAKVIGDLNPNLLMFVGVAGSLKPDDAPLGAVVVAERVYGYQSGKDTEDFVARPVTLPTWYSLSQLVRLVRRSDWSGGQDIPVVLGPVAAGDILVGSSQSDTYKRIRRFFNDAIAVEMESVGLYSAAHVENLPALSIRGISDCLDDKTADHDAMRQPVAASNAAAFAFAMLDAIGPEDISSPVAKPEDSPAAEASAWASVPSTTAALLQQAMETQEREAIDLLSMLAKAQSDPQATIDALLSNPPQWLLEAKSDLLWGAIGEFAFAHRGNLSASDAFERAAEAGGDTSLWLSSSAIALACSGGADKALEKLDGIESDSPQLPVSLARVVIKGDVQGILDLTTDADGKYLRPTAYRVQALAVRHSIPEAIDLAQRLVERHPGAYGSALMLARLMMQGAQQDISSLGFDSSLLRARDLAMSVRDMRRGWGGDSIEPTLVACAASMLLRDADTALLTSSAPPRGSALPLEAADDDVCQMRVDALLSLGRREEALAEVAGISEATGRKLAEADCLRALGRKDRAEELYLAAVDSLESVSLDDPKPAEQLLHGLIGLSELGVHPLPSIGRLRKASPEAARKVEIVSDIARGEAQSAIQAARSSGRPGDVALLVEALTKAGQADDAVAVLRDAAKRVDRTEYVLEIVRILGAEDRFKDAYDEAVAALAVVADESPLKPKLRKAAVQAASQIHDWDGVRSQATAAIAAGDGGEDMRWALVFALNNTLAPEEALAEAMAHPELSPRDEHEARLLISLHALRGSGLSSISAVLDIAEAFPASEEIGAGAFHAILMLSRELELPADVRERTAKASDDFFDRFPNSDYLKRIEPSPEKISEEIESWGDPWSNPDLKDVIRRISAGQLPLPMLTDAKSKAYTELLVKRGVGWTVGEALDSGVRARERTAAVTAVGHPIVLETSAVYGAMLTGLPKGTFLSLFPQIVVARAAVEDAIRSASDLALRTTSFLSWDALLGSPVIDETLPEEADRWAREAQAIEEILRGATAKTPTGRANEVANLPMVLEPVQLADELGLALYSDDVALRALAVSRGVSAFGTASLLAAGVDGWLDAELVDAAMDALRENRYVDMDWSAEDLLRIAEKEQFQATGGAAGALARPAFWSDPVEASRSYQALLARLGSREDLRDQLQDWQAAATVGFLQSLPEGVKQKAGGHLLSGAFLVFELQPSVLPLLLTGARQGAHMAGAEDPFRNFCRGLAEDLSGHLGEAQGARMFVGMVQLLSPEDRAVAMRELLLAGRTQETEDAGSAG